ncbi:MAG: hypothetical protein HF978_13920 [Desulfobacteraceae bacterium]|nr:hypothetical protein [Desulfobacteraceae bacterium]MBC2756636.1 hypothetical protein [Desulfobacteraceae bacterium]
MKKKTLKTKLIFTVFIVCQVLFFHTVSVFGQEPEIRVTIKGTLSNIADVGAYITSQTHLQLYPCETMGKLNVQMEKKGTLVPVPGQPEQTFYLDGLNRLVPPSSYPRIGLPDFGMFNFFMVRKLEPGKCYKICVMMLDHPYPGMVSLVNSDGSPLEIIIPEAKTGQNSHKIVIDLTKETVIIPEPQKR